MPQHTETPPPTHPSVSNRPECAAPASEHQTLGARVQRPNAHDPFLDATPPSTDSSRALFTLAAAVGVGTLLIACGLFFSRSGGSNENASAAPMTTTLSEQHKMMREAVQMAKDAQEMQRERMDLMRREMEQGERGADAPARAEGELVGD